MRELLLEIWTSVRRNKLRTFLTGFSVAWGIFMLVILLGSGNGLKNGVLSNFGNYATNSITISGGWTSKAYAGYNKWRSIDLKNRDLEILVNEFPEVDDVAAKAWYRGSTATYLDRFADISLRGSLPKIQQIEGVEIVKGRFINQADIHNYRKVIVIDEALERILFRGDDPLGKPVKIHNNIYRVAGVYRGDAQQRNSMGYIPLTTGQLIFKANDPVVDNAIITVHGLDTDAQMEAFEQRIRKRLAAEHHYDPEDQSALWIRNTMEQYKSMMIVFGYKNNLLRVGDVELDAEAHIVRKAGREITLTPKEFELLHFLLRNKGVALSRFALYERVWNDGESGDTRTLDIHITRLRKKLGLENEIATVHKLGYIIREKT